MGATPSPRRQAGNDQKADLHATETAINWADFTVLRNEHLSSSVPRRNKPKKQIVFTIRILTLVLRYYKG